MNDIETLLIGLSVISTIWGIRANLRAYRAENDKDIEDRTLVHEKLKNQAGQISDLHTRILSLEKGQHEVRALSDKVESVYRELDKKIDNLMAILLKER